MRVQAIEQSWTNVYVKDLDPEMTDEEFKDQAALMAMQGMLANPNRSEKHFKILVDDFFNIADAMLIERNKRSATVKESLTVEDGWIEWNGGECPVRPDTKVSIRLRGSYKYTSTPACNWYWGHDGDNADIIAYKVVEGS